MDKVLNFLTQYDKIIRAVLWAITLFIIYHVLGTEVLVKVLVWISVSAFVNSLIVAIIMLVDIDSRWPGANDKIISVLLVLFALFVNLAIPFYIFVGL